MFSREFCVICENTYFAEQHLTTVSDCSPVNSSKGSIGKRNCNKKAGFIQKQFLSDFKLVLLKISQIRPSVLEPLFNKPAGACNSIKKEISTEVFS